MARDELAKLFFFSFPTLLLEGGLYIVVGEENIDFAIVRNCQNEVVGFSQW